MKNMKRRFKIFHTNRNISGRSPATRNRHRNIKNIKNAAMKYYLLLFFSCACAGIAMAQDSSLLNMLEDSMMVNKQGGHVTGTFKGTRIINTHSVETPAKGVLLFMIMHRFGKINEGAYEFFGLDNATMRMGFDYGLTDELTVGIGRSTFQKTYDGYLKGKLLRQSEGPGGAHPAFGYRAGRYSIYFAEV